MKRFALMNAQNIVLNVCVGEELWQMPAIDGCTWLILENRESVQINDIYDQETDDFVRPIEEPEIEPTPEEGIAPINLFGLQPVVEIEEKKSYSFTAWLKKYLSFGFWR